MKAKKIHYVISDNPSPSICGRFSENYTRIIGCVTCKDCKQAIMSKDYSLAQFVKHDGEYDGCKYQDGKYCSWWRKKTNAPPPCQNGKKCKDCGQKLVYVTKTSKQYCRNTFCSEPPVSPLPKPNLTSER